MKPMPARFDLSDEEFGEVGKKLGALLKEAASVNVITVRSRNGTPWDYTRIDKFPSPSAWIRFRNAAETPKGLGLDRYVRYEHDICYKPEWHCAGGSVLVHSIEDSALMQRYSPHPHLPQRLPMHYASRIFLDRSREMRNRTVRGRVNPVRNMALLTIIAVVFFSQSCEPDPYFGGRLSVSFFPDPVERGADLDWWYTVKVTETGGLQDVVVSGFTIDDLDADGEVLNTHSYTAEYFELWFNDCGGSGAAISAGTSRCAEMIRISSIFLYPSFGHTARWTIRGTDALGEYVAATGSVTLLD